MKYYFAPLEGITGYIYRRAHHIYYPGIDEYYTPFIVPKEKKQLSKKEENDILPEHNEGMTVIPQIMTNKPEDFLRVSKVLHQEYGYTEINLNLGCPSKTVVSKKRGAGFLAVPDKLEAFLDTVCSEFCVWGISLSVKTRIGKEDPEEFPQLLEIFKKYPLTQLIIHPRIQKDFYKNLPRMEVFSAAYEKRAEAEWHLCYNGDLATADDCKMLSRKFPQLSAAMIGRGLLMNPMLIEEVKVRENGGEKKGKKEMACHQRFQNDQAEKAERNRRYELYRRIEEDYREVMSGEKDVLFKMKELWLYMAQDFTEPKKYLKKMKKAQNLANFEAAVRALCIEERLKPHNGENTEK